MNKTLFPLIIAFIATACSKDDTPKEIDPSDSNRVAANITVMHSEKKTDNLPAASNNGAIVLYSLTYYTYKTIAGKFAVIQPAMNAGTATGFYVQVNGTSGCFKVNAVASSGQIIIQLPKDIKPGQFKVTFNAFDANNNISNSTEAIIEIVTLGGTGSESFAGTWKLTGQQKPYIGWDYDLYKLKDGTRYNFDCINNKLAGLHISGQYPTVYVAFQRLYLQKSLWAIETGGTMEKDYHINAYWLDENNSACDNPIYKPDPSYSQQYKKRNGWIYNATTKRIIFLYNYETLGNPVEPTHWEELIVDEISASKMILRSIFDDKYAWEYTRQ